MITQAVILAGGLGTRLRPLTNNVPKPMIPIHGKPFLGYVIDYLVKNGITQVVILVGYKHEVIKDYFGNGSAKQISITYSYSDVETKTGTRVKNALPILDNTFLLLYGDNYCPLSLPDLFIYYKYQQLPAVVSVYSNEDRVRPNNIFVDKNGLVKTYDKSKRAKNLNGIDIGFFVLNKQIFQQTTAKNFSIEECLFEDLIPKNNLAGYITAHKYYSLTSPDRIPEVKEFLLDRKVMLLDRDGVINKKPAEGTYVTKWEEFEILPRVIKGLQLLQQNNYEIFVVSNQAGIARKMVSEKTVNEIHKKLLRILEKQGITITHFYICPHSWDEHCFCRKPKPGMLFQASREYNFDLTKATFIGDDERDMQAGKAAGCKTFLVDEKNSLLSLVSNIIAQS